MPWKREVLRQRKHQILRGMERCKHRGVCYRYCLFIIRLDDNGEGVHNPCAIPDNISSMQQCSKSNAGTIPLQECNTLNCSGVCLQ